MSHLSAAGEFADTAVFKQLSVLFDCLCILLRLYDDIALQVCQSTLQLLVFSRSYYFANSAMLVYNKIYYFGYGLICIEYGVKAKRLSTII